MKQQLTKEQSQRLIELGIPAEKASASIADETQGNGNSWTYPLFTIGDLLNLFPCERNSPIFTLTRGMYDLKGNYNKKWNASLEYEEPTKFLVGVGREPIDAMYELLCEFLKEHRL